MSWLHTVWAAQAHASWRVAAFFYFAVYSLVGLALARWDRKR